MTAKAVKGAQMKSFSIDRENNITAFAKRKDAEAAHGDAFASEAELYKLTASWPASRIVAIWNRIPGCVPVKKFTNRKTGVPRIWKAIQSLDGGVAPYAADVSPGTSRSTRARNKTRAGQTGDATGTPIAEVVVRPESKTAKVLAMLCRPEGATLEQIMNVTDWQAHSVRGFVSGTLGKKLHLTVASTKGEDGQRRYSVTA